MDVLPLTQDVARYELRLDETHDRLVLLDTPGYSDAGATAEQLKATREAVRQADLILLVMAATSPAKQADATMLSASGRRCRLEDRRTQPGDGVVAAV